MPKRIRPVPDNYTPSLDGRPRVTATMKFRFTSDEIALLVDYAAKRDSNWDDVIYSAIYDELILRAQDDSAR